MQDPEDVDTEDGKEHFATYFIVEEEEVVEEDSEDDSTNEGTCDVIKWRRGFQNKYQMIDDLGHGRFSVVKKVQRLTDGKEFAAKFIGRTRQSDKQTENEYIMMKRTNHSTTVRAMSLYSATQKFSILLMELVVGLPLLDWLFARDETSEAVLAEVLLQLVESLQYLQDINIAHLDIKPENILVDISNGAGIKYITYQNNKSINADPDTITAETSNGIECKPVPRLRLLDFGNARNFNKTNQEDCYSSKNHESLRVGSAEFSAPEYICNEDISTSSDLWSLGVLIYVLVSGHSPFLGQTHEDTCKNVMKGEVSFPAEHFARVTEEAVDLTNALIQVDPENRLKHDQIDKHPWFCMSNCDSFLPLRELASFSKRRQKDCSNTQPFSSSSTNNLPVQ